MKPPGNGSYGKHGNHGSPSSHTSHSSHNSHPPSPATPAAAPRILPPRGDYQTLLSYQKAEVIYDLTHRFAHRYLTRGDRTIDQMIQSARSGKQNILEGSKAAQTSKETEIKLTNVARASLEELLADYRDYLRVRDLPIWEKDSKESLFVRRLGRRTPAHLRALPRVFRDPPARGDRQHRHLPRPPDQLPARSAAQRPRTSLHPRRRPPRTHDPRPPRRPRPPIAPILPVTPAP